MTANCTSFGAFELAKVMTSFRDGLLTHQATINRLNVFPVPDGDTGTNMLLTVESVVSELDGASTMQAVGQAISHGSLMGARGNSGVILCQILRGLAKVAAESDALDGAQLALALEQGATAASQAVLRPTPGTILTVADDAASAAVKAATACEALQEVTASPRKSAIESVKRTPELLAVLKDAGVVDAGGAGLLCLYDALWWVATGQAMPETLSLPGDVVERISDGIPLRESSVVPEYDSGQGDLRYEVMYFLDAPDDRIAAFKDAWAGVGDSIVVVGGDGLYNCHIHTNDIGAAIEAAIDVGRPRQIRVTDLDEQVQEERWVRQAPHDDLPVVQNVGPPPLTSIVTVATGDGIRRVFHSLGAEHVVAGGQSMNPSTEQILAMIERAPGDEVVVLPNNTNIYPVAAQAAQLSSKPVFVVATAGVQEGFAALLDFDPQLGAEENATAMSEAASRVVCGEVTQAVRSTMSAVGEVAAGDFIGLSRSGIEAIADSLSGATIGLLEKLISSEHEIVTVIEGAAIPASEMRTVSEWIADRYPKIALERIQGDQPLYPFLISIE